MKFLIGSAVVLLSVALHTEAAAPSEPQPRLTAAVLAANNQTVELAKLTLHTRPAYCYQNKACLKLDKGQKYANWTIKALTPFASDGKTKPVNCSRVAFDAKNLTQITINNLNRFWPSFVSKSNESTWTDAFNNDGRCFINNTNAIKDTNEYFAVAIQAFTTVNVTNTLLNGKIWPRDDKPYSLQTINNTLTSRFDKSFELVCSGTRSKTAILREIKFCFNKQRLLTACVGGEKTCTTASVWYLENSSSVGASSVFAVLTAVLVALFAARE